MVKHKADAPALPEVKQCNIIGDPQFGSTATAAGANRWLVANPNNGGHWATDADVSSWAAGTFPAPVEPLAPQQDSK